MCKYFWIATFFLINQTAIDAYSRSFDEISSEQRYGVRVSIKAGNKAREFPLKPSDPIVIEIIGTNRLSQYIGLPNEVTRFIHVDLLNHNGTPIPKTALGRRFGKHFFINDPEFSDKKDVRRLNLAQAWHRPMDIFEIEESGNYTMMISIQFYIAVDGRHRFVRYQPIAVPITKEK